MEMNQRPGFDWSDRGTVQQVKQVISWIFRIYHISFQCTFSYMVYFVLLQLWETIFACIKWCFHTSLVVCDRFIKHATLKCAVMNKITVKWSELVKTNFSLVALLCMQHILFSMCKCRLLVTMRCVFCLKLCYISTLLQHVSFLLPSFSHSFIHSAMSFQHHHLSQLISATLWVTYRSLTQACSSANV